MIAPRVATRIDQMLNPVTPLPPSSCTTKPPSSAPIIPMTIVSRKPPGSLPGMISLPKIPAISPITIQLMMPILIFFPYLLSIGRCSFCPPVSSPFFSGFVTCNAILPVGGDLGGYLEGRKEPQERGCCASQHHCKPL